MVCLECDGMCFLIRERRGAAWAGQAGQLVLVGFFFWICGRVLKGPCPGRGAGVEGTWEAVWLRIWRERVSGAFFGRVRVCVCEKSEMR